MKLDKVERMQNIARECDAVEFCETAIIACENIAKELEKNDLQDDADRYKRLAAIIGEF